MSLVLFNTMGRTSQEFIPCKAGEAGFYGCGPTVYNYAHIGNLRAYVSHDILVRLLRRRGYKVTHVMNITDVGHLSGDNDEGDDKMVKSAEERGKSVLEIAAFYTKAFFNDIERLNIALPDIICKATEHIDDMIALIQKIEANGFTYFSGGNLYFDVSKFPRYGALGRVKPDAGRSQGRIEADGNKRNPEDFVLWFTKSKFANHALVWDSPWGRGYPGWHIECSAMSMKYLGAQFDIHAGGIDHIQIHHSNEIAQSEAATGAYPWVKYWFHNEFLVLDKGKMSKSIGGFITLQNLVDLGFHPLDYRYFLLGGHYRSQLQFSMESLGGAKNARHSLLNALRRVAEKAGGPAAVKRLSESGAGLSGEAKERLDAFDAALDDDLSTPKALAALWALVKDGGVPPESALAAALAMDSVLSLGMAKELTSEPERKDGADSAEIEAAIAERGEAKKRKDFARADEIRASLKEKGVILEDGPTGTNWRRE
ncbi:MAG: cysteine--tRNA ligase [Spirochaetaceae bacterium]|jgi:cysteinyl-tRNA synthetase|nr:cysteine--tRNA ligase [Spirochaetaceae bacterium]